MTSQDYINNRKLIYGIGINDADYITQPVINGKTTICPYYRAWANMLKRCYSSSFHGQRPTYIGCTVVKEWHSFMNFRAWMEKQNWHGKHIDKDIIFPGNKAYSPETCVFVNLAINGLLGDHAAKRGKYPQGVVLQKQSGKFIATLNMSGKAKYLGYFETPEEASAVYREAKRLHILTIACCEPDIRVKQGLYRHSETFRSKTVEKFL